MGLLSVDSVNTSSHGAILDVWEVGGAHRKLEPPFKPYMYNLRPDARGQPCKRLLLSDMQWHTVWKLTHRTTDDLERSRTMSTVEDTFPFKQRIAIDVGYKFKGGYPRLLAWDIETDAALKGRLSPNWRKDEIISIATWGDTDASHRVFDGDRRKFIPEFLQFWQKYDADVPTDFFGRFYDMPCLIQNCESLAIKCALGRDGSTPYIYSKEFEKHGKGRIENTVRIRGRVHFDVHKEVDEDYTLTLAGLKDRTLKTVGRYYGLNPIQIDYAKMATMSQAEMRAYNLSDARCTYEIAQIYFRGLYELSEYLNTPIDMIIQRQPSHVGNIVVGRQFQKLGIISDGSNKERFPSFYNNKRSCEGAFVKNFQTGIFFNVDHIDYSSFYPSIMIAFNLSPETVKLVAIRPYTGKYNFSFKNNEAIIEVPDKTQGQVICRIDMSKDGILRKILTDLKEQRKVVQVEYKKTHDHALQSRQWALKIVGNALFGYNLMTYSNYGNVLVGLLTTAIGRYIILNSLEERKKLGKRLIEVDSDGWYETC
jgi:DNA polymerase I